MINIIVFIRGCFWDYKGSIFVLFQNSWIGILVQSRDPAGAQNTHFNLLFKDYKEYAAEEYDDKERSVEERLSEHKNFLAKYEELKKMEKELGLHG